MQNVYSIRASTKKDERIIKGWLEDHWKIKNFCVPTYSRMILLDRKPLIAYFLWVDSMFTVIDVTWIVMNPKATISDKKGLFRFLIFTVEQIAKTLSLNMIMFDTSKKSIQRLLRKNKYNDLENDAIKLYKKVR